jgi:outer membrane lipoprotein carrier protein
MRSESASRRAARQLNFGPLPISNVSLLFGHRDPPRSGVAELLDCAPAHSRLIFRASTPMRPILFFVLCVFSPLAGRAADAPTPDLAPIKRWIARQDDFHTVQADFTQTRALRALRSPVAIHGHLWFVAPDLLRWELGDPPKTVVLRKGATYFLIQPAKKKVERSAAGAKKSGMMQALAMMSFPLAKDFNDFNRQFEVLNLNVADERCHFEIAPRDLQERKFLEAIKIDFDTANGRLLVFEMVFRDGSSMRNDFLNVKMNQKIDSHTFDYDFTGYEVSDAR